MYTPPSATPLQLPATAVDSNPVWLPQLFSGVCPGRTGYMLKTADFTALSRSGDNLFVFFNPILFSFRLPVCNARPIYIYIYIYIYS